MERKAKEAVQDYYCNQNMNCAVTLLHALSEFYDIELSDQVYAAATGMNGGGCYGGQCGLVEGPIMFLGARGAQNGLEKGAIVRQCCAYTTAFQEKFGSILCKDLRPGGFSPDDPPHLCKQLCEDALALADRIIEFFIKEEAYEAKKKEKMQQA